MLDDDPPISLLDSLYAELRAYEAQAAIVEALIASGDDCEWNTRRLSGWTWNIQVAKNRIAREEARCLSD